MNDIIQLKIILKETKPQIWRRVLVEKTATFEYLHHVIQISMGWTNSHLHEFEIFGFRIYEANAELDEEFGDRYIDSSTVTLENIITETKEEFNYHYDFGESWNHQIIVEKFLPRGPKTNYPKCTDGKLNCPPEDCGGIDGFYRMLNIINNKLHPQRKKMLKWLGGEYDINYFDKHEINEQLASLDEYLKKMKRLR